METFDKKICVRVTTRQYEKLKEESENQAVSMNTIVRIAIVNQFRNLTRHYGESEKQLNMQLNRSA